MLGLKLMGTGVAGLLGGGMLLLEGLKDDPNNLITGGLWKGPVLMVLGVIMLVIGARTMMTPQDEPEPQPADPSES